MNKKLFLAVLPLLAMAVTACGGNGSGSEPASASQEESIVESSEAAQSSEEAPASSEEAVSSEEAGSSEEAVVSSEEEVEAQYVLTFNEAPVEGDVVLAHGWKGDSKYYVPVTFKGVKGSFSFEEEVDGFLVLEMKAGQTEPNESWSNVFRQTDNVNPTTYQKEQEVTWPKAEDLTGQATVTISVEYALNDRAETHALYLVGSHSDWKALPAYKLACTNNVWTGEFTLGVGTTCKLAIAAKDVGEEGAAPAGTDWEADPNRTVTKDGLSITAWQAAQA